MKHFHQGVKLLGLLVISLLLHFGVSMLYELFNYSAMGILFYYLYFLGINTYTKKYLNFDILNDIFKNAKLFASASLVFISVVSNAQVIHLEPIPGYNGVSDTTYRYFILENEDTIFALNELPESMIPVFHGISSFCYKKGLETPWVEFPMSLKVYGFANLDRSDKDKYRNMLFLRWGDYLDSANTGVFVYCDGKEDPIGDHIIDYLFSFDREKMNGVLSINWATDIAELVIYGSGELLDGSREILQLYTFNLHMKVYPYYNGR